MINQRVTLDTEQAASLAMSQSRVFARDLTQGHLLGPDVASEALEFDLALAQLKVLRRHGLLAEADTEELAQREILRRYTLSLSNLEAHTDSEALTVIEFLPTIESQIDVARAYMDMGNAEGARHVLENLLEEVQQFEDQVQTTKS